MRFYRIDVMDFYRGTLSARRLGVLVRQLPVESALVRAMNDGVTPWSNEAHRLADLWALTFRGQQGEKYKGEDHPLRAEMETNARNKAKRARVIELKAVFEQRKRTYGLGVTE